MNKSKRSTGYVYCGEGKLKKFLEEGRIGLTMTSKFFKGDSLNIL